MKNFIALNNNSYSGWQVIGKFEKLKPALDCTARFWKKSNGHVKSKILDIENREVVYFKNKEIVRRPMSEKETKKFLNF